MYLNHNNKVQAEVLVEKESLDLLYVYLSIGLVICLILFIGFMTYTHWKMLKKSEQQDEDLDEHRDKANEMLGMISKHPIDLLLQFIAANDDLTQPEKVKINNQLEQFKKSLEE